MCFKCRIDFHQHCCLLQVPNKDMADHILKLTVIDAGRTKRRAIIGHVTFPLRELAPDSEQKLFKMDLEKVSTLSLSSRVLSIVYCTSYMHSVLNFPLDGIVIGHFYSVPVEFFRNFSHFSEFF